MVPTPIKLRSQSKSLNHAEAEEMIRRYHFFDIIINRSGQGFENIFKKKDINGDKVVFDKATGLFWQQGGSGSLITFTEAENYVAALNKKNFAGCDHWRLPTLEEAMSLMAPEKNNEELYIHSVFDEEQQYIWTSDPVDRGSGVWVVLFDFGRCFNDHLDGEGYARAVRSG